MPAPNTIALVILGAAAVVFPMLFFIPAPYGRHLRSGWGPTVPAPLGWAAMESVSLIAFALAWWKNDARFDASVLVPAGLYCAHYLNRSVVDPLRARGRNRRIPYTTVLMAVAFNALNGSANGAAVGAQPWSWRFALGLGLFVAGALVNIHSDAILRSLRAPGESGYKVPQGGFFRWVSAPNYLGELLEWAGFALALWNLPALAFLIFTAANLVPRARANHRWYREKFPDYPPERRALVPGLY